MSFRLRVFAALASLIAAALVGAWLLAGGAVLRPLIGDLQRERVDLALYVAEQVELSPDPVERAAEIGRKLGTDVFLAPRRGWRGWRRHALRVERDGRTVFLGRGPGAPVAVPLRDGSAMVVVRFPADLEASRRRVGLGLAFIGVAALLAAVAASRWVIRPLDVAAGAMQRVADGDLAFRVPEGADAAGRIGRTFNRMAERVQGMVEAQRRLVASVSHELRTPLTRMRLQVEMLRDSGADPRRLNGLERDIDALDELVGELLESVRLGTGASALRLDDLSVREVVREALDRVDLGERPVRVEVPEGLRLVADRTRLRRALENLLSNVARYTPPEAEVAVRAERCPGGGVLLAVADRGPGVAPADLERLFEPFFRAEASRSRATGGVGLGLAIVRQVAEAHGGRATARNREGGGLEVRLELPARPS